MHRALMLIACLAITACTATANRIPDGKTEGDWEADERYCLNESGKITGFFAHSSVGLAVNLGGADERYKNCLKELGWLVEPGDETRPVRKERIAIKGDASLENKKDVALKTSPPVSSAKEIGKDSRFIAYDNGIVLDTRTNLMWAAKDNGKDIGWRNAKSYCEQYGYGGYTDWRMPTHEELSGLYDADIKGNGGYNLTSFITLTSCCPWASDSRGTDAALIDFRLRLLGGIFSSKKAPPVDWLPTSYFNNLRVLPVRSTK